MVPKFLTDENVPFEVVEALRKAGYDVATVADAARAGIRNDKLAEISIRIKRTIITRDADFTRLKKKLAESVKVLYINLSEEPEDWHDSS